MYMYNMRLASERGRVIVLSDGGRECACVWDGVYCEYVYEYCCCGRESIDGSVIGICAKRQV